MRTFGDLWIGFVRYDARAKAYLRASDHYLQNPPPGALFAIGVERLGLALFADVPVGDRTLVGLCVVGRPEARGLPQDGSTGEITRLHLAEGLPHGLASQVLGEAVDEARRRGMSSLIAYHDRTRHSGCVYRKAGFRKDGSTRARTSGGWSSRPCRERSAAAGLTPKRRWRLDVKPAPV
jgi:GNAT superfamily N-acetyltransferase